MKISEMTNEQAADVLVRIATPFANICDDEQIQEIIKKYSEIEEGTPIVKVIAKIMPEAVACAFKKHKNDLFEVVGALTLQGKDKVAKMNFLETIKVIKEALTDEELTSFFTSFRVQTEKTEEESVQG